MDDVIVLVKTTYEKDEELNSIPIETRREVLCQSQSVGRSEFYSAAQADMHPEFIFILSHFKDYEGEKIIEYTDWMNRQHKLYVTRTYRVPGTDRVELTAEERTGYGHEHESGGGGECCPGGVCARCTDCD